MKTWSITFVWIAVLSTMLSCRTGRYAATEKIYVKKSNVFADIYREIPTENQLNKIKSKDKEWIASVNFGMRKPNFVMIHHTAQQSTAQTVKTFHLERTEVSAHYVIGRDGKIIQMVNDYYRAHHAGAGKWGNDTDLNSSSIGIELDNNGTTDPWPEEQIDALIQLLAYLKETYRIPQANFIGHMDYAPGRKNDPSRFPWKRLAESGFGYWYGNNLEHAPEGFDVKVALRIIGYDIKNLDSAIKAFKGHYIQTNTSSADLSEEDMKILYAVYQKFL